MSKALVINGADFSTNKVTTISFGSVPCEGISFDESSITVTSMESVALDYTVTPSNTTDAITWASSDDNVVSVSNGTLTVNGIGTATVTVTCGSYSDTLAVTVSIAYIPNWQVYYINSNEDTITSTSSTARVNALGTGSQATTYETVPASGSSEAFNLIKCPANTVGVKITVPSGKTSLFASDNITLIRWAKDESCGNQNYPQGIKYISSETSYSITSNATKTFAVPEGADSFVFTTKLVSMPSQVGDANSAMESTEIAIEFLSSLT